MEVRDKCSTAAGHHDSTARDQDKGAAVIIKIGYLIHDCWRMQGQTVSREFENYAVGLITEKSAGGIFLFARL